jgi:hypothetical protein
MPMYVVMVTVSVASCGHLNVRNSAQSDQNMAVYAICQYILEQPSIWSLTAVKVTDQKQNWYSYM